MFAYPTGDTRNAVLAAFGFPPWSNEDEQHPDSAEAVLKRRVLSMSLPTFAPSSPVAQFRRTLRGTITTTTEYTAWAEADFNGQGALVVAGVPLVKPATFGAISVSADDIDVEIALNQEQGAILTGRELDSQNSVPRAVALSSFADNLIMLRVPPNTKLGVRFRSRYYAAGVSGLGATVTADLTLLWSYA